LTSTGAPSTKAGVIGFGACAAHSPGPDGRWHRLDDHLTSTGELAATFGDPFGAGDLARWAGRWHDLGKASPEWQEYLRQSALQGPTGHRPPTVGHKAAGALWARQQKLGLLAAPILGHHGGMPAVSSVSAVLDADEWAHDALQVTEGCQGLELDGDPWDLLPGFLLNTKKTSQPWVQSFLVRMVFSALADADFLDTEAHFKPFLSTRRTMSTEGITVLHRRFDERRAETLTAHQHDPVAIKREDLADLIDSRAGDDTGLFTLSAPTGSGKTLSSLRFALHHAEVHGLRRIVVAVPYISVTTQTAKTYRSLFDVSPKRSVVLEHHSGIVDATDDDVPTWAQIDRRLATENWDAEIIVTTTVQLLESLFSNRPGRCRKLHNLAQSVIIVDEPQSIPWRLIDPTVATLRELTEHYGSSVVLTTATPPPVDLLPASLGKTPARELVDDPTAWADSFKRVEVDWRPRKVTASELAEEVRVETDRSGSVLVVLNSIADAVELAEQLRDVQGLLHLSTNLCPAHRRQVIDKVERRLDAGDPCVLITTQIVEAGVDLDFPVGFRVVAPATSIAQAAGRVNRHGRTPSARLIVVDLDGGRCPPDEYLVGQRITRNLLNDGVDLLSPSGTDRYFRLLFDAAQSKLSALDIIERCEHGDYPAVADAYRLITDSGEPVLVRWGDATTVDDALAAATGPGSGKREAMRRLQPYLVSLRSTRLAAARDSGLITDLPEVEGLWMWTGDYDPLIGLTDLTRNDETW